MSHETELVLIGAAVAVGLLGILIAYLSSRAPVLAKDESPADTGLSALLANAYHVDEVIDSVVLKPLNVLSDGVLSRGVDRGIDGGLERGGTAFVKFAGKFGERLQNGDAGTYAWVFAVGALAVLASLTFNR